MFFQFANVLVFFGLAVLLVGGMLALGSLLRPQNPEPLKLTTYECGEPPTGSSRREAENTVLRAGSPTGWCWKP